MAEVRTVVVTGASPRPRSGHRRTSLPTRVDGGRRDANPRRRPRTPPRAHRRTGRRCAPHGRPTRPRRSRVDHGPRRGRSSTPWVRPMRSCTTPVSPPSAASKSCPTRCGSSCSRPTSSALYASPANCFRRCGAPAGAGSSSCRARARSTACPAIGAYSASKGALERWAESLSQEIAPFGLGVTVLVAGAFKTDILELTQSYGDPEGPYGPLHANLEDNGRRFLRFAGSPEKFAAAVAKALEGRRPFARHGVGLDARLLLIGNRLIPAALLQRVTGAALGLPRPGTLRSGADGRAAQRRLSARTTRRASRASERCSRAPRASRTATTPGCRPTARAPRAHRTGHPAPAATADRAAAP